MQSNNEMKGKWRIEQYIFWGKPTQRKVLKILDSKNIEYKIITASYDWLNRKKYWRLDIFIYLDSTSAEYDNIKKELDSLKS